ncbi:MAG: DUF4412 domain-containing protein, partial [Thermodesulfobacteriota bacterium]
MRIRFFITGFFAIVLFLSALSFSSAEKLAEPDVEYSAERVMKMEGRLFNQTVYHAPGKERGETEFRGQKSIMIIRTDKELFWTLMPMQKMYMEHPIEKAKEGRMSIYDVDVKFTELGKETINGMKTTKSKVTSVDGRGVSSEGIMWMTGDGIVVRYEMRAKGAGGAGASAPAPMVMELKNLKIGKQPASLFEIPAGYQKFTMPSIPGMPGGGMGGGGGGGGGIDMDELMKM